MKQNNTAKKYAGRVGFAFLLLALLVLAGCANPFDQDEPAQGGAAGGGLVTIRIGGISGAARTVQPAATALAGYQLTFAGSPAHDPVEIPQEESSVEVVLYDGTYTVTATAYKIGGTLGNVGDAVAEGSISLTLSDGVVTGGAVPPIILGPITEDMGTGTLQYSINTEETASGTMTLWDIDGIEKANDFATDGELTIPSANPVSLSGSDDDLPPGRYITEIRLENASKEFAVYREVTEIWPGLTTEISFAPTAFYDPQALLNSGAALSATSTIGGVAIEAGGDESGADEANAITYSLMVPDITDAPQVFVLESASLFADISWTATDGTAPGEIGYGDTEITDFLTDNVLWVKVVSENQSTTRYYKFTLTEAPMLTISPEGDGASYSIDADKIRTLTITEDGDYAIGMKAGVDVTTTHRVVVNTGLTGVTITLNGVHIDMSQKEKPAFDMTGATVTLTISGANVLKGGANNAGLDTSYPTNLTITGTGSLNATGGSNGAGIGGGSGKASGKIYIYGGTVTATGGTGGAGIGGGSSNVSSSGAIYIYDGTVTATGGTGGAGIGGGSGGNVNIYILDGTVKATGGTGGAGIGSGTGGSDSSISINGGTVTATGGTDGAGIGGGKDGKIASIFIYGGTVDATCGGLGAGIGGGRNSIGTSSIRIEGGTVNATAYSGAGIGGGCENTSDSSFYFYGCTVTATNSSSYNRGIGGYGEHQGTIYELAGNAVVFASSIGPVITGGVNARQAIVFNNKTGTMYGDVTLREDIEIPSTHTLTFFTGSEQTLSIPDGVTLTNNGTINKNGGDIVENGTLNGTGTVND